MRIEFDVTVTTPMFIGGNDSRSLTSCSKNKAEQLLTAEGLRVPSLRGAMRFWFRAIAGRVTSNLAEIKALETRVFGGTSGDATRSAVRIQSWPPDKINVGQYGVRMNKDAPPKRWAIEPDTQFQLALSSHHPQLLRIAIGCLWMVSNFGGVGARTRRGFGGIAVRPLTHESTGDICFGPRLSDINQTDNRNLTQFSTRLKPDQLAMKRQEVVERVVQELKLSQTVELIRNTIRGLVATDSSINRGYSTLGVSHLIWPSAFDKDSLLGWANWKDALEHARQHVYVPFKNALCLSHIGNPVPQHAAANSVVGHGMRYTSPLCLKIIGFSQEKQRRYAILATVFDNDWHLRVRLSSFLNNRQRDGGFSGNHNRSVADYWQMFLDPTQALNGKYLDKNVLEAWPVL